MRTHSVNDLKPPMSAAVCSCLQRDNVEAQIIGSDPVRCGLTGGYDVDGFEPGLCQFWPSSDGKLGAPKPVTVPAIGIKMHLRRNFGVLQGEEVNSGVLYDERWRSFLGDVNLGIRRKVLFRKRQVARINDYRKIGTAANLVGVIDRIVESLFEC